MTQKRDGLFFGILFLAALAVYWTAFRNYFINDDLIHLDFVRSFKGNYLDFLFPHVRPSDVVTGARYEPFHIYFYALLYPFFRDFFPAYQFLHIGIHALNAFLIYKIAKKLGLSVSAALIAGMLFCVYRLNSQSVLWYAAMFCTAAVTGMLLAFLLFLRQEKRSLISSVLLYSGTALLSLRAPQYLLMACAYVWIFRGDLKSRRSLEPKIKTLFAYASVSALLLIANAVSWHHFPNRIPGFEFDFFALPAFLLNLVFPYEAGILLKCAGFVLLCAVIWKKREDKIVCFLAAAILLNAFFWGMIFSAGHLPYAPRYSYLASGLFCILAGYFLSGALWNQSILKRFFAGVLILCLIAGNAFLLVSKDIVWFRYLSVRGKKLEAIARLEGPEKKKVLIAEDFFSNDPNLNYFKDKLEFVSKERGLEPDVFHVDLEREQYAAYFGREMGKEYWFQPWFIKKPCKENTPWC